MKKRYGIVILFFVSVMVLTAASYAALSNEFSFNNRFETSAVNIRLDEYSIGENGERKNLETSCVVPGQHVSYIPEITNQGAECYVRLSFEVAMQNEKVQAVSLDKNFGLSEDWIRQGNYYYCIKSLKPGDASAVFSGFIVPDSWDSQANSDFTVTAAADAIQARNFDPDFDKANPWGSVEIKPAKAGGRKSVRTVSKFNGTELIYERNKTFECSTEDLFAGFGPLFPGDEMDRKIPVINKSGKEIEILFRTDNGDSELLRKTELEIKSCGKLLYQGDMSSKELKSFIKLASIPPQGMETIEFCVSLPAESDNDYAQLDDQVTWIISAKEVEKKQGSFMKTGDSKGFMVLIMIIVCTLMAIIILSVVLFNARKQRNVMKNDK